MVKPAELIEIKGAARLTLTNRRLFNLLLRNAFGPSLGTENRHFEILLSELRDSHESNDRLVQSVEALMTTVITIKRTDGSTDRVQLLGWNNLSDPRRKRGSFKYAIPPELALLLRDSTVFAKLELEALRSFTSKYALALYEGVARRIRFRKVKYEIFSLNEIRDFLGVEPDKLETFGNLNQYAIKPAVAEVNKLSEFSVSAEPQKTGRRVTAVLLRWDAKKVQTTKLPKTSSPPYDHAGNPEPEIFRTNHTP
jgi:plasmid replication initiation protein